MQKNFLGICSVKKLRKKHLLFEYRFHWLSSTVKDWLVILSVAQFLKINFTYDLNSLFLSVLCLTSNIGFDIRSILILDIASLFGFAYVNFGKRLKF